MDMMVVTLCPLACVEYDEVSVGLVIASQIARQEDGGDVRTDYRIAPLSRLSLAPQAGAGESWIILNDLINFNRWFEQRRNEQ